MDAWALAVVILGVLLALGTAVLLLRQPNPADLSEQDGKPARQGRHVVERPAGPDAERMDPRPSASKPPGADPSNPSPDDR